ncbi:SAM-dependent methyltransferase [Cryptosporangium sp. NPDC048952]
MVASLSRLSTVPEHIPVDLRTDIPHSARIYDYILGGSDNCPPDRAAG